MRFRRGFAIAGVLTASLVPGPAGQEDAFRSDLVERTGVALVLLDVEVTDDEGRPVPGLTLDDFDIQLNARFRPLYSLDDLCPAPGPAAGEESVSEPAEPPVVASAEPLPAVADTFHFVLYLDFAMLDVEGRARSLEQARRWVRETMRVGEEARVVAYASDAGLRELAPFTADRETLLAAIDAADADPELVDPFPAMRFNRMNQCIRECCGYRSDECPDTPQCCLDFARREATHGRRAMRALATTLRRLEYVDGRKTLIYFHDSAKYFPGRDYGIGDFRAGDLTREVDEVAAEANLAGTGIHVAFSGADAAADNFGANLADFSGGSRSRGLVDLAAGLDRAGRSSGCFYRLGIREPPRSRVEVHRVKVYVRGKPLDQRRRVVFLDEIDRWWRRAQDALERPQEHRDLDVRTALLPRRAEKGKWDVEVRVAVGLDTLAVVPIAGDERGEWEVGGLLAREDGKGAQEMLARSELRGVDELGAEGFVVHSRELRGIRPGSWRLGAFARDRTANVFGADRADLTLPPPGRPGIAGPVIVQSDETLVTTGLPLLDEQEAPPVPGGGPRVGSVPATSAPIPAERPLDMVSWLCGAGEEPPSSLIRFVSREGIPIFRFDAPLLERAGQCLRLVDRVETAALTPGRYEYRVRWMPQDAERFVDGSASFVIGGPPAVEAGSEEPSTDPAGAARLERLLERVGRVADLYLDNVLRFTCDETIFAQGHGAPELHNFRYVYVYSEEAGRFRDYRVPAGTDTESLAAGRIELGNLGLPVYLLRAYSWIFVFHDDNRPLYTFHLEGEDEALHRPALRVRFEPKRPYIEGFSDWFGTAWVDVETGQLLRVEAMRPEGHRQQGLLEAARRPLPEGSPRRRRSYRITTYETLFDVVENGMRFPGKVTIEAKLHTVGGSRRKARVREAALFHISQTYKRYRFFGVRSEQEIRSLLAGEEAATGNGRAQSNRPSMER